MSTPEELELQKLLEELAPTEEARAQLLEEHRQLEKDLLRLADPLPPPDFLHKVMTRVAEAPARAPAGREVFVAAGIVVAAVVASVLAFTVTGDGVGGIGLQFAQVMLRLRETAIGLASALSTVWRTAALPLTVCLGVTLTVCLMLFKRVVSNGFSQVKVAS